MERNIVIESLEIPIEKQDLEMVERKGIGHPDTICDECCEAASKALSQYYVKNFGHVLHHNLDKGLLIAGSSERKFNGGKILKRIKFIIAGRATDNIDGKLIPVNEICEKAAKKWLIDNLGLLKEDIEKLFEIVVEYEPGSVELVKDVESAMANDTSFGVSHGPFSKTEKLALDAENFLNSKLNKEFPAIGKDIKVMALRNNSSIRLTIAIAFIDRYVSNVQSYFEMKEKIKEKLLERLSIEGYDIDIQINTLDNPKAKDEEDLYLTVTGLSAEQGDDGQVGRGNRINGLITPCRGMSLEAAAGKNINHPGKLYQILANEIANKIAEIDGVIDCQVKILSKIGSPLNEPEVVDIKLASESDVSQKIKEVVNNQLDNLPQLQKDLIK